MTSPTAESARKIPLEPSEPAAKRPTALRLAPLSSLASAVSLVACGGGSSPAPSPSPPPSANPSPAEAARFLHQAQFSASDAEIASVQSQGHAVWLEQQLSLPPGPSAWDWLMAKGYNATNFLNSAAPADFVIWNQLITSPDAVRRRVALALSEIMVVSSNSMAIAGRSHAMAAYWDTLCAHAFGNYRQLLEAITLNPAMGVYLNNKGNQKEDAATGRQPDENYAREVMQLFTIGLYELNADGSNRLDAKGQPIDTYDLATITNLARVFTGWDFDPTGANATNLLQLQQPMRLTASRHSSSAASFLGTTIPANTDGNTALKLALDILFNHANVGPFVGRQLIQRLVTSNPSPAYIARVTAAFNNNGNGVRGDMKAVVRAVLLDAEARSASNMAHPTWGKLREPMLRFVQWARTFKATSASGDWKIPDLSDSATRLGQSPLRSGSVFNFFRPGYVPPNTALASTALVAPELQITNESTVAGYINFMQTVVRAGLVDVTPDYSAEMALVNNTAALTDRLNLLLCAGQLSAATLASIRTAIGSISTATAAGQQNRVYAAILLTLACPQYIVQK